MDADTSMLKRKKKHHLKADQMMMTRRDVKPGNGASLLSYQNHASLKRNLKNMRSLVDDRTPDYYTEKFDDNQSIFKNNWNSYTTKITQENNKFFQRLISIANVSHQQTDCGQTKH